MIKRHPIFLMLSLISVILIAGCTAPVQNEDSSESLTATPAPLEFFSSSGPFLLLQTDNHVYEVIDLGQGTITPYPLPDSDEKYNLASSLSPGGAQMILHTNAYRVQIMDLLIGKVRKTYELEPSSNTSTFQLDQAVSAIISALPDLKYSEDEMLNAIETAYSKSLTNVQWYQDDEHILFVSAGTGASTNLYLEDLHTGERDQLEDKPGLVESAWVSPNGDYILLKKGFDIGPGIWQDDCYYLVTVSSRETRLISLPEDVDNPSLSWLTPQSIGIIHQTVITGGIHYSVIEIPSLETRKLVEGDFTFIRRYLGAFLALQQHQDEHTTSISMIDVDGKVLQTTTIEKLCTLKTILDKKIILNCETESLLLDADLQDVPFGEAVFLLTPSPDGSASILVNRSGSAFLLNAGLEKEQTLILESDPLEIRWLPDSSGFLYRTLGALHYYDLSTGENLPLVVSDLFGDYTNLNAVWINTD